MELQQPYSKFTANNKIEYIYNATGTKQKKKVTNGAVITTTDYAGNYIYQNNALQMINQPEGYLEPNGQGGYDYGYRLKDHLGNIRITFVDFDHNGSIALSEITEENNYYPFGLKHQGYNFVVSSNTNAVATKFKYNDKELNDELGLDLYDYGARFYDAALGRWHVIDPLADNYSPVSPYNYVLNNPNLFIDPDGKDVYIYYVGPRRNWYNKPIYYFGGHTALGARPVGYSNVTYANLSGSATRTKSTDSYKNEYGYSRYINESKTIMDYARSGDIVIRMRVQLPKEVEEIIASYIATEAANGRDQGGLWCTTRAKNILYQAFLDNGYTEDEADELLNKLMWYSSPEFTTASEMLAAGFVGADFYFMGGEDGKQFTHLNFDFGAKSENKEDSKKKRKGLNNLLSNFENLSEGTYTWDGNNWVKN